MLLLVTIGFKPQKWLGGRTRGRVQEEQKAGLVRTEDCAEGGGGADERGLGGGGECTANAGRLAGRELSQRRQCLVLTEQTCSPSPEMLLKMKNPKPLRVYGEAIETLEYPYPGSNQHLYRKTLRDAKPKHELR